MHGLEAVLGVQFLDASVYLMSDLPAYVELRDVALIAATAFVALLSVDAVSRVACRNDRSREGAAP